MLCRRLSKGRRACSSVVSCRYRDLSCCLWLSFRREDSGLGLVMVEVGLMLEDMVFLGARRSCLVSVERDVW